jgi:hypothetical protein
LKQIAKQLVQPEEDAEEKLDETDVEHPVGIFMEVSDAIGGNLDSPGDDFTIFTCLRDQVYDDTEDEEE